MPLKDFDSVESSVENFLRPLDLDDMNQARAQIALSLARTLDTAKNAENNGAMQQSVAGTSKQLLDTLKLIADSINSGDTFLDTLLKPE